MSGNSPTRAPSGRGSPTPRRAVVTMGPEDARPADPRPRAGAGRRGAAGVRVTTRSVRKCRRPRSRTCAARSSSSWRTRESTTRPRRADERPPARRTRLGVRARTLAARSVAGCSPKVERDLISESTREDLARDKSSESSRETPTEAEILLTMLPASEPASPGERKPAGGRSRQWIWRSVLATCQRRRQWSRGVESDEIAQRGPPSTP